MRVISTGRRGTGCSTQIFTKRWGRECNKSRVSQQTESHIPLFLVTAARNPGAAQHLSVLQPVRASGLVHHTNPITAVNLLRGAPVPEGCHHLTEYGFSVWVRMMALSGPA